MAARQRLRSARSLGLANLNITRDRDLETEECVQQPDLDRGDVAFRVIGGSLIPCR